MEHQVRVSDGADYSRLTSLKCLEAGLHYIYSPVFAVLYMEYNLQPGRTV